MKKLAWANKILNNILSSPWVLICPRVVGRREGRSVAVGDPWSGVVVVVAQ